MRRTLAVSMFGAVLAAGLPALHAAAPAGSPDDAARGATLFSQRCAICHTVAGRGGKVGPDLTRVAGRTAASGGFAYSPALKKLVWKWTPANLDTFLKNPAKVAPGTMMPVAVANPDDRKAIIAYLSAQQR